jgi:hypothetical protein
METRKAGPVRLPLLLGLAVLAPIAAESLVGYDDSTGDPLALLAGLFIFIPLYGAPAILIREAARRLGIGWGGVLAIAAAFGVVQAGIIDQSLFSANYRDIGYWQDLVGPTWLAPFGFAASPAIGFVFGHLVMSFTAPIVIVEGFSPRMADRPWLRPFGIAAWTLAYLGAAWVVLDWHYATESDHASAGQLIGAGVVALALASLALLFGRRKAPRVDRRIPPLWVVIAAAALTVFAIGSDSTWAGVALAAAVLCAMSFAVAYFARSDDWGRRQVTALAVGALLAQALSGFLSAPIGDVEPLARYAHNTAALLLVASLGWWTLRRTR